MRLTILRMISTNSLSAFSTHPAAAGATGAGRLTGAAVVQQARAQQQPTPSQASGVPSSHGPRPLPQSLAPGQVLPRGSLLDLSV